MIGGAAWRLHLDDYVSALSVGMDGSIVAGSLGGDAVLLERDGSTRATLVGHPMGVLAAAWSADGSRIAVGGQDGLVHIYDASGGRMATIDIGGWVQRLAWSPTATRLAAAAGRSVLLIDGDGDVTTRYADAPSTVTDLAWAVNGLRVGATAYGGVHWYDPADTRPTAKSHYSFKGSALSLVMSPTGRWACAGFQDASIHLWKLWSGDDLAMTGYPAKIEHLAFRHDGNWMAAACVEELTLWDFSGRGPAGRGPATGLLHERHIAALAWEPGGDRLVTGGADGRLAVWASPRSTRRQLKPLHVLDDDVAVAAVRFEPSGGALVVGRSDGTVERRTIA
jgi:WD40 repeat protein